jgi:hypothetical protein
MMTSVENFIQILKRLETVNPQILEKLINNHQMIKDGEHISVKIFASDYSGGEFMLIRAMSAIKVLKITH